MPVTSESMEADSNGTGGMSPPASESVQPCIDLVEAIQASCRSSMNTGVDLNCGPFFSQVDLEREKYGGALPLEEGGEYNLSAQTACTYYLPEVRRIVAEATGPSALRDEQPSACRNFQADLESHCLDPLGTRAIPRICAWGIQKVADGWDAAIEVDDADYICTSQHEQLLAQVAAQ